MPGARLATDEVGAAQIDRILARRRSELARLGLSARSATRRCEQAEARLAERVEPDGEPTDLLAVVDTMIERSVRERDAALAAARRDADETIARAVVEGVEGLRRAGVDTSRLPATRRPSTGHTLTPAPTAGDLWRRVGAAHMATAQPPLPGASPDADGFVATDAPSATEPHPTVLPGSSLPAPDGLEELGAVAVATLVAGASEPVSAGAVMAGSGDAEFDSFWREASQERRVRDRFRRRGKEDA